VLLEVLTEEKRRGKRRGLLLEVVEKIFRGPVEKKDGATKSDFLSGDRRKRER